MPYLTTMKISIDTKEDSHEDIRKVVRMLQHLVGDSQEVFTNEPSILVPSQETQSRPLANIFGDSAVPSEAVSNAENADTSSLDSQQPAQPEESSQSTEDLFAELFSEEDLKKMDIKKEDEGEIKPAKGKKYGIELY